MSRICESCGTNALRVTQIDSGAVLCDICYQDVTGRPAAPMPDSPSASNAHVDWPVQDEWKWSVPESTIALRSLGFVLILLGISVFPMATFVGCTALIWGELIAIRHKLGK